MPQGIIRPTNAIVAQPANPLVRECEVGANATAAKMLPGRIVIYDTADYAVKEAGAKADNVLGVLDVAPGKKVADAYAVGDQCRVIVGECDLVVTLVSGGAAVAPGDAIVSAADGKAAKLAVGAMGAQGSVIGRALETRDPAAADLACLVHFKLESEPAAAA